MQHDNTLSSKARGAVTAHYARNGDMRTLIREALPATGGDPTRPTYDALHQLDQFHLGGPEATRALAERVGLHDTAVLDLGCGIGGPARTLAQEYGCEVTGVDLTESFCQTARDLSAWVDLAVRTHFVCASVHGLPFAEAAFPWVWTQHAIMNIPDTARMYAEAARVLQPGGFFVHHDIVAGEVPEPRFPVPWASRPEGSFLQPAETVRGQIRDAGLTEVTWRDLTDTVIAKSREAKAAHAAGAPEPPGPHLVQGPEFLTMRANLGRNLEEGRVRVVQGLWRKDG
jgi:SAM-dependent methyltransferase